MASAWRNAAAILLPFRRTFRRLELEKRWWHRFCVVLFFVSLFAMFIAGSIYGTMLFSSDYSSWSSTVEKDTAWDSDAHHYQVRLVRMPDRSSVWYPVNTPQDVIWNQWNKVLDRQQRLALLWAVPIGLISTVFFSYVLQCSYRALLYVIFGGSKTSTQTVLDQR